MAVSTLASLNVRLALGLGVDEGSYLSFFDSAVLPLLELLAADDGLKLNLCLSQPLVERREVQKRVVPRIREFAQAGKVEVLSTFACDPLLGQIAPSYRVQHLKQSREFWERQKIATHGLVLRDFAWESALADLWAEAPYVVVREQGARAAARACVHVRRGEILVRAFALGRAKKNVRGVPVVLDGVSLECRLGVDWSAAFLSLRERIASLRGSSFVLNRDLLSFDEGEEIDEAELFAEGVPESGVHARALRARVADLEREFEHLPPDSDRLPAATQHLLRAQSFEVHDERLAVVPSFRRALFEEITRATVEIDAGLNPEVDPAVGWVRLEERDYDNTGTAKPVVDTQLARFYFTSSGELAEFDYKPRKIELASVIGSSPQASFGLSLVGLFEGRFEAFSRNSPHSEQKTIKHSLDLLTLRFAGTLGSYQIFRDYTFRAGIGAHLSNSTTGFSLEYWVDGDHAPPSDLLLALDLSFALPSANENALAVKPLLSVGAISELHFPLIIPRVVTSSAVEGGIFGLRLIDGIESLVIDLRSAKQLTAVSWEPVRSDHYHGAHLQLLLEARRVFSDDHSNTLFISIP